MRREIDDLVIESDPAAALNDEADLLCLEVPMRKRRSLACFHGEIVHPCLNGAEILSRNPGLLS